MSRLNTALDDREFTNADLEGTAYVDGFPAILKAFANHTLSLFSGRAKGEALVGHGIKILEASKNKGWFIGQPIRVMIPNTAIGMYGKVLKYDKDTGILYFVCTSYLDNETTRSKSSIWSIDTNFGIVSANSQFLGDTDGGLVSETSGPVIGRSRDLALYFPEFLEDFLDTQSREISPISGLASCQIGKVRVTFSNANILTEPTAPGFLRLSCFDGAVPRFAIFPAHWPGLALIRFRLSALAGASLSYKLIAGLVKANSFDFATGVGQGFYAEYSTASANWRTVANYDGTDQITASAVAVTSPAWHTLAYTETGLALSMDGVALPAVASYGSKNLPWGEDNCYLVIGLRQNGTMSSSVNLDIDYMFGNRLEY